MRTRSWAARAAAIAFTLSASGAASGDMGPRPFASEIFVENAGFEHHVFEDAGARIGEIFGWEGSGVFGTYNPIAAQFPAGVPEGDHVAFDHNPGTPISQVLGASLSAGVIYTVQVDVGNRLDLPFTGYSIGLYAGGELLAASANRILPPAGGFSTVSVTYAAVAADPHLGKDLEIRLGTGGSGVNFDNVRVFSTPMLRVPVTGTSATLAWAPSAGQVAAYGVYIARNGEPFPEVPELVTSARRTRVTLKGKLGDGLTARVAAFDTQGTRGPFSPESSVLHLVAGLPRDWSVPAGWKLGAIADFDADGLLDLLWQIPSEKELVLWRMDGLRLRSVHPLHSNLATWKLAAAADFDGDHRLDLLWRDPATGSNVLWRMQGPTVLEERSWVPQDRRLQLVAALDLDGNGRAEPLWRNPREYDLTAWWTNGPYSVIAVPVPDKPGGAGEAYQPSSHLVPLLEPGGIEAEPWVERVWSSVTTLEQARWAVEAAWRDEPGMVPRVPRDWELAGLGDFDGDGSRDLVWHDPARGTVVLWLMDGFDVVAERQLTPGFGTWNIAAVGDFDGNGCSDLLWRRPGRSGDLAISLMVAARIASEAPTTSIQTQARITAVGDLDGDRRDDLLWFDPEPAQLWLWWMDGLDRPGVRRLR